MLRHPSRSTRSDPLFPLSTLFRAVAHLAFLADPEVSAAAERTIDAGKSAGFAWRAAIEGFVAPLLASADRRFAERIDDLRDLEHRVLVALDGGPDDAPAVPEGAILVADDLLPSQLMAQIGRAHV